MKKSILAAIVAIVPAMGVCLIVEYLTKQYIPTDKNADTDPYAAMLYPVMYPVMVWIVGWGIHLFA